MFFFFNFVLWSNSVITILMRNLTPNVIHVCEIFSMVIIGVALAISYGRGTAIQHDWNLDQTNKTII